MNRQIDRQADRQIERQREKERQRERESVGSVRSPVRSPAALASRSFRSSAPELFAVCNFYNVDLALAGAALELNGPWHNIRRIPRHRGQISLQLQKLTSAAKPRGSYKFKTTTHISESERLSTSGVIQRFCRGLLRVCLILFLLCSNINNKQFSIR